MNPFGVTRQPAVIDTAALLKFNATVERAKTEYHLHPSAVCRRKDCTRLAKDCDLFCQTCRRDIERAKEVRSA